MGCQIFYSIYDRTIDISQMRDRICVKPQITDAQFLLNAEACGKCEAKNSIGLIEWDIYKNKITLKFALSDFTDVVFNTFSIRLFQMGICHGGVTFGAFALILLTVTMNALVRACVDMFSSRCSEWRAFRNHK